MPILISLLLVTGSIVLLLLIAATASLPRMHAKDAETGDASIGRTTTMQPVPIFYASTPEAGQLRSQVTAAGMQ